MASDRQERDLDIAGRRLTGLPASAAASDAVRRDEMLAGDAATLATAEAFTTSSLIAQAFGTANSTTLQAIDASVISEGAIRIVTTYMAPFKLVDGTVRTRTTIPHQVLPAAGRTNWWWVRVVCDGDPFWQAQTVWYIDPAGTNSTPGNDEADGLSSSTPIKSIAEWRRRIRGAAYTANVVLHALSSSTAGDDGLLYGFTTSSSVVFVVVLGTPATIGVSGTVSSYQPYSGNTRGSFADPSLVAASWTAAGAISTSTGSRYVRRVGSGSRQYAPLLKDMGTKTVQFGIVTNWDETNTSTLSLTETHFSNGDNYEVVSLPTWPAIQNATGNVRLQCVDVLGGGTRILANDRQTVLNIVLCGFITQMVILSGDEGIRVFSGVFCHPTGTSLLGSSHLFSNCAFVSSLLESDNGGASWTGQKNVFVSSELRIWHNMIFGSLGEIRSYDNASACITVRHNSTCKLIGPLVGSGNSGSLVQCDTSGILYGAASVTATTSQALPYNVNGVLYAAPVVDAGSGDGIYN